MSDAQVVIDGLGGVDNIVELESCMLRVRAIVRDPARVSELRIREINPIALVTSRKYVQIILGARSDALVEEMMRVMKQPAATA